MKTKRIIATLLLVAFASLLGGCGDADKEKAEFYRKANEGQKQADELNKKAAEDIKNFQPNSSPYKEKK